MNVHKRCKDLVANTCGVNPRLMADILHDMVFDKFLFSTRNSHFFL